ncbi:protein rolling stone-like isoform X2 [Acanthaster planci]|uniref:Protein rolling stone-like isoform X2 n=1 Tax=Acanthaster planci TaxID=133434 RepID=A0A8B7ZPQ8_ACAPL|nr:protein rolling stone-like isoform X2 [Acanthaster planci]
MTTARFQRPKLADIGFTTDDSSVFYRPQNQGGASFIYLTTYAFMIFIAYNVAATVNVIWDGCMKRRTAGEGLLLRHKTHWFLFAMTTDINFLVTLVYWCALYMPSLPLIYDLTMHTLTSVVCLLDLALTPVPVRLLHCIYPLLLGTVYLAFTVVFWAVGGYGREPIYWLLDYSNYPGRAAGAIVGIFVALLFLHVVVWALYKLKLWIWFKCDGGTRPRQMRASVTSAEEHCIEQENLVKDPPTAELIGTPKV